MRDFGIKYVAPELRLTSRAALNNIHSMQKRPLQNKHRATPRSTDLFQHFIGNAYLVKELKENENSVVKTPWQLPF